MEESCGRGSDVYKMKNHLYLSIIILVGEFLNVSALSCLIHNKCLEDLAKFSQANDYHIYTSLEEAEAACSKAKDAYLCVAAEPECRDESKMAELSPIVRGSFRLLNEFCGFRSKRRPCCAFRTAYLEHSECYEEISERLNECNDKYRRSLDKILTIRDESEQNKQRFCSVKWLGKCMTSATQSYCGKSAAQIIKSYSVKAGKPEKRYLESSDECGESLYGSDEDKQHNCEEKQFYKCRVHLFFLHEYLVEDRLTDDEKFLSVCTGIHDSLECFNQAFKRCIFSYKVKKLDKLQMGDKENEACLAEESILLRHRGNIQCVTEHIQQLSQCQLEFDVPVESFLRTIPYSRHNEYFCGLLEKLETCWMNKAFSYCGNAGREVMEDIIHMAAIYFHTICRPYDSIP